MSGSEVIVIACKIALVSVLKLSTLAAVCQICSTLNLPFKKKKKRSFGKTYYYGIFRKYVSIIHPKGEIRKADDLECKWHSR
jgi:hypothetical protein